MLGRKSIRTVLIASSLVAITSLFTGAAAQQLDTLSEGFANPSNDARPRVWWHWIDGNITKDGIAKDLAWMKRIGIGGAQTFDIAQDKSAPIVAKRLVYMSPEWKEAFRFAAAEADRLNLELTIASSPGWSETGGPWVQPKDGLKKLVWSETEINGGKRYGGKLAVPPVVTGPFQSIAAASGARADSPADHVLQSPAFYQDIAVLVFPLEQTSRLLSPIVRSGGGKPLDGRALIDLDLNSAVALPSEAGRPPAIVLEYPRAQTIRSATLYLPGGFLPFFGSPYAPVLEASDDGNVWRKLADVPVTAVPTTLSFAPIMAKQFRVTFNASTTPPLWTFADPSPGTNLMGLDAMVRPVGSLAGVMPVRVGELRLSSEGRIDRHEAKAGFEIERDYYQLSQNVPDAKGVDPARVIDLTSRLRPDGTLDWSPPSGRWRILRLGYSLLGTTNHPAPAEATGLEVDKFDGAAVRRYLEHYMAMYRETAGAELVGKRGVQAILTDSYEVGAANWTPQLIQQSVADAPRGYGYDFVNAEALLEALSNDSAEIATPGGARYHVLYLGGSSRKMTLPVLRKISTLVRGGATLVGRRPESSPSLADNGAANEFERLAAQLWPGTDVAQVERGQVIATGDVEAALARLGVAPDFRNTSADPDGAIPFVHRKLPDGDTYFLVNEKDRPRVIEARFRVAGKVPELWHAETGKSEAVSYRIDGNETVVPLTLLADESVHVVFRRPVTVPSAVVDKPALTAVSSIEGPWTVKFQPERGAPSTISLPTLRSLSEHSEPGVRYFSGIATYTKSFTLPSGIRPGDPLWIDLGKVGDIAEVRVNGTSVGSAWHAPYRIKISGAVRNGANQLEIRVANRWVNRLIGDAQAGAEKVTWTAMPTYKADAPLRPSGLIGHVTLLAPGTLSRFMRR